MIGFFYASEKKHNFKKNYYGKSRARKSIKHRTF